jgi:hypothetical protein
MRQIGFHDESGTTHGGAGGPTIYRGHVDWLTSLQNRLAIDPAPFTGPDGRLLTSAGHAFIDDMHNTVTSIRGTVNTLTVLADFFALHDGSFNLDKTLVAMVEYMEDQTTLKMFAPAGVPFDESVHIPRSISIPNNSALYTIECARSRRSGADPPKPEESRELLRLIIDQTDHIEIEIGTIEPDTPYLYLGVWMTAGLHYKRAIQEAKAVADLAAAAIMATSIKPKEAQQIARSVPLAQAVYKLKCTSASKDELLLVDTKLRAAVKTKSNFCRTFANPALDGTVYESISNAVLAERIMTVLRLLRMHNPASDAMQGSIWRL